MVLSVTTPGDSTWSFADWADAKFAVSGADDILPITVPGAAAKSLQAFPPLDLPDPHPALHGPHVMGCEPGHAFLYRIPATGRGALNFSASNLAPGLTLASNSGIISGVVMAPGDYPATLRLRSAFGTATQRLDIQCGPGKLALTPVMGWNAWNSLGEDVTQAKVLEQADALGQERPGRPGIQLCDGRRFVAGRP